MSFQYDVFSEEEALDLLPDGDYTAEIMEFHSQDKNGSPMQSKSGIPMVMVKLSLTTNHGVKNLTDYILLNKQFAWKFRHFCDSIGRIKEYEDKTLSAAMILGSMTCVNVNTQPAKDGYPKKNGVNDYVKQEQSGLNPNAPMVNTTEPFTDEIPF